jgi:hypothetical protein
MRVLKPPHLHKHVYLLPRYKFEGNYILNTECNAERQTYWLLTSRPEFLVLSVVHPV